jgi:hypothetical protein
MLGMLVPKSWGIPVLATIAIAADIPSQNILGY